MIKCCWSASFSAYVSELSRYAAGLAEGPGEWSTHVCMTLDMRACVCVSQKDVLYTQDSNVCVCNLLCSGDKYVSRNKLNLIKLPCGNILIRKKQ